MPIHSRFNRIIFNFVLILAFTSCYLINRSGLYADLAKYIDIFIAALLVIFILFDTFVSSKIPKFFFIIYLMLIASIIPPLLLRGFFNVHWVYVIFFSEIVRLRYLPNMKMLNWIIFFCLISIVIQMMLYHTIDGRPVLSIGDPNYSSYYIAILISLSFMYGKKLMAFIFSLLGMLMISRVFTIWGLIFFGLIFFYKVLHKMPRLNSLAYLIILVCGPLLFSYIFIQNIPEPSVTYISDYSRLSTFTDKSNFDRALANIYYIGYVFDSPMSLITGVDVNDYTENIFYNTPHASIYATVFNYGILFLIAEMYLFKKNISSWIDNYFCYAFLISWLIWQCFLGGVLFGPQIIILGVIINKSLTIKLTPKNHILRNYVTK